METFNQDTDFLLRQRELSHNLISKKHSVKVDSSELRQRLFSQVSKKMVESLHSKYRVDFEMFEYDVEEYLKFAKD